MLGLACDMSDQCMYPISRDGIGEGDVEQDAKMHPFSEHVMRDQSANLSTYG